MQNILTVDVEDWYQGNARIPYQDAWRFESRIEKSVDQVLGILDEYETQATFFILGHLAESHGQVVKQIQNHGHEIATHGYSHQLIFKQTPAEFAEELYRSIALCEDLTGRAVMGHRASNWSVTSQSLWALDLLKKAGLRYDSSVYPVRTGYFGISGRSREPHILDNGLIEVPPSTVSVANYTIPFAGGVFLRTLPYGLVEWAVRRVNAEGHPAVVYLHPWELDQDQPKNLPVPFIDQFIHYHNLDTTEAKLRRLCSQFSFGTVMETIAL